MEEPDSSGSSPLLGGLMRSSCKLPQFAGEEL